MQAPTISQLYENQKQQLDDLLFVFQQMKEIHLPEAGRVFRRLVAGLEQRMSCEEEILFRLYEDENGLKGEGPTEVLRVEHRQIRHLLEDIHWKLAQHNPATDGEQIVLRDILAEHHRREGHTLSPTLNGRLTPRQRDELLVALACRYNGTICEAQREPLNAGSLATHGSEKSAQPAA